MSKNHVIHPSLLPRVDIGEWDLLVRRLKNTHFTQKFDMTLLTSRTAECIGLVCRRAEKIRTPVKVFILGGGAAPRSDPF